METARETGSSDSLRGSFLDLGGTGALGIFHSRKPCMDEPVGFKLSFDLCIEKDAGRNPGFFASGFLDYPALDGFVVHRSGSPGDRVFFHRRDYGFTAGSSNVRPGGKL